MSVIRLTYRRPEWDTATGPKVRLFETVGGAVLHLQQLQKRGPVQARFEERTRYGRWREIPIPAVESAEQGGGQ